MKTSKFALWGCLTPIVALLLLLVFSYVATELRMAEGKRKLPTTASDIEVSGFHGIIGGDHRGLTKASIPRDAYPVYAKALCLTTKFDPKLHADIENQLNMQVGDAPGWWNPPKIDQTAYFDYTKGSTYYRVLRYNDGFVYYFRLSW